MFTLRSMSWVWPLRMSFPHIFFSLPESDAFAQFIRFTSVVDVVFGISTNSRYEPISTSIPISDVTPHLTLLLENAYGRFLCFGGAPMFGNRSIDSVELATFFFVKSIEQVSSTEKYAMI
ncbi:hypothetical protein NL676_026710 [Syzygium grande]|nr:hypothetical protein NL676_026710 [Syzygium grande]